MKTHRATSRGLVLAAFLFAGLLHRGEAADPSPFQNLAGTFSKKGRVQVTGGIAARGKCKLRLSISPDGLAARLRMSGEMRFNEALRPFTDIVVLRRDGTAAISNLAPGIDDGRAVGDGVYRVSPRALNAEFTFTSGTTAVRATVFVRTKKTPRGTRLLVTQTLETDALPTAVTWRFRALSRNPK